MAYKYQNEIEDAVDVMVKVMGEEKHGKAQQELAEVYRKAEAFDAIWSHYDRFYEDEDRPVMEQFGDEMADILNEYEQRYEEDSQ